MTTTGSVDLLVASINAQIGRVGPGLYGVACSGGADSIALADAAIRAAGPAHVVVLAIDHGLSAEAAAACAAVAAWARGQGAAAVIRRVQVARRSSLEAAARDARYAALDALAGELGLACIFTGHTARDQAETVVLRLLRGTGPAGLAAIPAVRGVYVRPFLALGRDAIDAYVQARELPVWSDPMNADRRLARVRVRAQILPALRAENPRLDAALVRLAASAAEWLEVIDAQARPLGRFPIAIRQLAAQPAAIRKRALALALEAAGLDADAHHLAELDRVACQPSRGEIAVCVAGGVVVRSYDVLQLRAAPLPLDPPHAAPAGHELRAWQPGDRMRPARLGGRSRKLSDLFIDAKIPRALRRSARVLVRTADATIVWAEHLGAAFGEDPIVGQATLRSEASTSTGDGPQISLK
ncbi:MAG TPA: tRNA lysidine(34) synthetase TilS [Kofleriaceae bacterium]